MSSVSPTKNLPPEQNADPPSIWSQLLQRMNPRACLSGQCSDLSLEMAIPTILTDLESKSEKRRKHALERLYALTDQKHRHYRIDLVEAYSVQNILIKLMKAPEHCRMACLTLNNLSIPAENKSVLLQSNLLLKELWRILEELSPETYVACLCLMNLSHHPASHARLLSFSTGKDLLTLLESMMVAFAPHAATKSCAEARALTYATVLLKHVTLNNASACIAQGHPELVRTLLEMIQLWSDSCPLHEWTQDSLGDASLVVIFQLVQSPEGCSVLQELHASQYVGGLIGKGGIHDTRASWIQCALEGL